MSDENIIDVDQNETDTCEEITNTDTISGEDKSENISTNEAAGTTEDIDAGYSIDEEPGESSEDTSCSEANETTTVSGATASQVAETAGSKRWNEYTSSTDLDDTDELMILDTSAKANKRTLLSKLADYVLGKLADKVFAKLETRNQTVIGALNELNSKQSKTISVSNVTDIQTLVNSATGGTNILFHLAGAGYTGSDLPKDTKYGYGSGIIFYRNSGSCKIVLFPEGSKPVWKTSDWTKWRDFANNIVD